MPEDELGQSTPEACFECMQSKALTMLGWVQASDQSEMIREGQAGKRRHHIPWGDALLDERRQSWCDSTAQEVSTKSIE